jgi:hypothetical protein
MTRPIVFLWATLVALMIFLFPACTPSGRDTGPEGDADADADADTDTDTDAVTTLFTIEVPDIADYYDDEDGNPATAPMPDEPTVVRVNGGTATPTIESDCDEDLAFGETCNISYTARAGDTVSVELVRRDMVLLTQTFEANGADTTVSWDPDQIYWNMCEGTYEDEWGWTVDDVEFGFADLNGDGRQVAYVEWLGFNASISGNFGFHQGVSGRDEFFFGDTLENLVWRTYTSTGDLQEEIPMWCSH